MKLPAATASQALPDGYELLVQGARYDVVIRTRTKKELTKKVPAEKAASLEELLERYGEGGPSEMPSGKFNSREGWFPSEKNKQVKLEAFKPHQMRAYGFCRSVNGKPTFIITGLDRSKKQDRGDQDVINAAGNEAVRVNGLLK